MNKIKNSIHLLLIGSSFTILLFELCILPLDSTDVLFLVSLEFALKLVLNGLFLPYIV